MTLEELQRETLVQKHQRLMQAKCRHEEIWHTSVCSDEGTFTQRWCIDCGKYWHYREPDYDHAERLEKEQRRRDELTDLYRDD